MHTGPHSEQVVLHRKEKKRRRRRRLRQVTAVALAVLVIGIVIYIPLRNRDLASEKERDLRSSWERKASEGLPQTDITALQTELAGIQNERNRLLAPWDGYDDALAKLSDETTQRWQAAVSKGRAQAKQALTSYEKTRSDWTKQPQQTMPPADGQKLATTKTPADFAKLASQWNQANYTWQNKVAKLKKLGGGFIEDRPADIVRDEQRLEVDIKDRDDVSATVLDNAKNVVKAANAYLNLSPDQELKQHDKQLQALQSALIQYPAIFTPFGASFQSYVNSRQSQVSVAVYSANNGKTYTYRPDLTFGTASIVKATIMADLLLQSQKTGKSLTKSEQDDMVPMIENSDNDAATDLWNVAGEGEGIEGFLKTAGMDETVPGQSGYWGLTMTTAVDQMTLMKLYAYPNAILDNQSRAYGLNLMEHITSWEDWGVSAGPTSGTVVALKNGWLPSNSDGWRINSIGYVDGNGHNYVVAILSQNNPSEQYGIDTVEQVSRYVWDALGEEAK